MSGTGYDLSVTSYSREGRIFQVEYAQKHVDDSETCVGLVLKDGVVLCNENSIHSPMLVPESNRRIFAVDHRTFVGFTGLAPDARQVVNRAKAEAAQYFKTYRCHIPGKYLAEQIGGFVHLFTLYGSVRPYGCSVLIAQHDGAESSLFSVDPWGNVGRFVGEALGKGRQVAKTEIEKLNLQELTCQEAVFHVSKIIGKAHDEARKDYIAECWWATTTDEGITCGPVPENFRKTEEARARAVLEDDEDVQ